MEHLAPSYPMLRAATVTFGPVQRWMVPGEHNPKVLHADLNLRTGETFSLDRDASQKARDTFDLLMLRPNAWAHLRSRLEWANSDWARSDESVSVDFGAVQPTPDPGLFIELAPAFSGLLPGVSALTFLYQPATRACVKHLDEVAASNIAARTAEGILFDDHRRNNPVRAAFDQGVGSRHAVEKINQIIKRGPRERPKLGGDPWGLTAPTIIHLPLGGCS